MQSKTHLARRVATSHESAQATAVDVGQCRVSAVTFTPRALSWHYHERPCLTVVLDGGFVETFATRAIDARAGGVLIKPGAERHHDRFSGSAQVIVEPSQAFMKAWPLLDDVFATIDYRSSAVARAVALRIADEILTRADAFTPLSVEGLTLELMTVVGRRPEPAGQRIPDWLRRVRERLEDEPDPATMAELADVACVSPGHLSRSFRRHFGASVGQYSRRLRLEWAARELATTDESLSHIADRAGFADQSHFTRAFRRQWGVTPAEYRRATRTNRRADTRRPARRASDA